jgi:hypothetical protein
MPKNNEINKPVNGEVADANIINQIILNAGNEAGAIPYDESDHQRDTLGSQSLGSAAYPWGTFCVSRDKYLMEIETTSNTVASQVAIKDLRKFISQKDTPDSYSGEANKLVAVNSAEDAVEFVNPPTKTPLVFAFATGGSNHSDGSHGVAPPDTAEADPGTAIVLSNVWAVYNTTYRTILTTKYKKLAGSDTVRIYAHVRQKNVNTLYYVSVKVDIGGENNSVNGSTTDTDWEWVTFDVDVSNLSDDSYYDVTIQLKHSQARNAYMDSIVAFAL